MGGSGWTPKEGFIAELNVIPGEIIQQMLLEAGQEPRCCGGSSLLPKIQPQSSDGVMGTIPSLQHHPHLHINNHLPSALDYNLLVCKFRHGYKSQCYSNSINYSIPAAGRVMGRWLALSSTHPASLEGFLIPLGSL